MSMRWLIDEIIKYLADLIPRILDELGINKVVK